MTPDSGLLNTLLTPQNLRADSRSHAPRFIFQRHAGFIRLFLNPSPLLPDLLLDILPHQSNLLLPLVQSLRLLLLQ